MQCRRYVGQKLWLSNTFQKISMSSCSEKTTLFRRLGTSSADVKSCTRSLISHHDEVLKCAIIHRADASLFLGCFIPAVCCPLMDGECACDVVRLNLIPGQSSQAEESHPSQVSTQNQSMCSWLYSVQSCLRGIFIPHWMFFVPTGMERDNNVCVCARASVFKTDIWNVPGKAESFMESVRECMRVARVFVESSVVHETEIWACVCARKLRRPGSGSSAKPSHGAHRSWGQGLVWLTGQSGRRCAASGGVISHRFPVTQQ